MTNPEYKGRFKKTPLSLGLPVLENEILSAYFSKMGKKGAKTNLKKGKKYWKELSKKGVLARKLKKQNEK